MPNGLTPDHVNFLLVFLEGIFSFFSPCVLPLIPIYISYLAGNAKQTLEDGTIVYQRKRVFFHTVFFVLGISAAFFLLGISFSALGSFFQSNKVIFTRIGGVIIILLGLFQMGVFDFSFLQRERKIHLNFAGRQMNPLIAFVMGFTFSFAWTPCVGPALSSVLILASSAKSALTGNLLVLVYALGFIIPFLLVGLFTTQVLNFLKGKQKFLKYTIKVGGALLIVIGVMTFTGWMNGISGYLNTLSGPAASESSSPEPQPSSNEEPETPEAGVSSSASSPVSSEASSAPEKLAAFDFTLTDQNGAEHTLSDYKGKVVFLNFWATWCGPCQREMPDIEALYKEYGENSEDVVFLGVSNPKSQKYPQSADVEKDEVLKFLDDNGYTFPVVFDETGEIYEKYGIRSYPTTFLIDKEGNFLGYVPGQMTKSMMENVIQQAKDVTGSE